MIERNPLRDRSRKSLRLCRLRQTRLNTQEFAQRGQKQITLIEFRDMPSQILQESGGPLYRLEKHDEVAHSEQSLERSERHKAVDPEHADHPEELRGNTRKGPPTLQRNPFSTQHRSGILEPLPQSRT